MFKRINIEISNICNVQCSFCPVVERDKKIMSPADFERVIQQAAPLTEKITLHLMGEPLAHPKLDEILKICERVGIQVEITTNGILLRRHQDLLLSSPIVRQVNFSLQAYLDNFPNRDFRQYFIPLLEFTEIAHAKRSELYINFRLWNVEAEQGENEQIFREMEIFYGVDIKRTIDVGHIKSKRIWNRVYLHFDSRFDWPSMQYPFQGDKGKCHGLSGHFGIHADGTVVPCCLDMEAHINLGNCLNENLTDILSSERAISMKEGFARGELVEDLCQHCSYIKRFSK
jgi:radical SAM protein with 4Fe4S-binding SPASM domain